MLDTPPPPLGHYCDNARNTYREAIRADVAEGLEIKDKILGQSILGGDEFIEWVKERFIKRQKGQEIPSVKEIQRYRSQEAILKAIEGETGKGIHEIKKEKGLYRQTAMDLLYRIGGFKGGEIGGMMRAGYTAVSQERKRLWEKAQRDKRLRVLMDRIERNL